MGSKDALEGVVRLSWATFWCPWGALGGYVGGLGAFRWLHEFLKRFIGAPLSPHIGPRGALGSPLVFEVVVFILLEPLGVDFELPSGPSDPQKTPFY